MHVAQHFLIIKIQTSISSYVVDLEQLPNMEKIYIQNKKLDVKSIDV